MKDEVNIESYETYRFQNIIHHLFDRGEIFVELMQSSKLTNYVDEILGNTSIIHSYNGVRLMPKQSNNATKIHRDSPRFYPQSFPLSLQALVCIDPFTLENGATYLLPASHHSQSAPSNQYFYDNAVRVVAEPGDVIFFDSLVWHAGGENRTQDPRRGLTIVYSRSFMKQQIDLAKSLSDELINSLSPLGKRLIGMSVRAPSCLDDFYLPEDQRLYKANQG